LSSGGFFSQSRTVIAKLPKWTVFPTGASISVTRAVTFSRPCSTATGSAIMSDWSADATGTASMTAPAIKAVRKQSRW